MSNPPLVVNPVVIEGWRLPFDVMSGIMAMSTRRSTISTLMKTCHTLYTEGPKHLLCDGVQLNGSIDIVRFADFMLTGDPSRFAHLRKLVLNIRFFVTVNSSDVQARFIDLLAHPCLSLETLILHQTDVFMGRRAPPSLREAFCKLKTIKRLVALGVRGDSASIIQSLPSPLESISIGVDLGQPFDILPTLKPFSDTLHTLLINSKPSSPARSLFETSQPPSFPHISTFGVVWDDSVPELLASPVFARTFPAISHLKLVPPEHPVVMPLWQSRVFGYGEPQVGSLARQLSVAPQIQTSQHQTRLLSSLRGLNECSGELSSVSMLSLQCTLSSLRLWKPILIGDLPALGAVLEEIRPRRLCLTTLVDHVADVFTTFSTLQTQAPPRIDLDVLGSWGPESAFSEKVLKKIRSSLEPLFKQPPPTGLAELSLLFVTSDGLGPSGQPESLTQKRFVEGGGIFAAFTRWASGSRLTLTWRSSVDVDEEERRWPYLGQIGDDDDDDDSDYGYDYANDYDNESDEIRHFCGDDDEYDSDQWRRWNDDD